jgi:hypothetical protein
MAEVQQEMEFTEEELTGTEIVTETVPVPGPTSESAVKPPEEAAPPTEPVVPEKPAVPEKPPKGYVPEGAFKEERRLRKEFQAKLDAAEAAKPPPPDPAALILEDPEEAVRMLMRQNTELRDEMNRKQMERDIKSEVPDFFDKAPQIEEMLLGKGLSEEAIRSMIGSVGAEFPKLFKVFDELVSQPNADAMRSKITAELTPSITAEITRQLMAKFNIVETGKDIGKLPGSAPDGKMIVDGEQDYNKLTPEQQEKWLRGEI